MRVLITLLFIVSGYVAIGQELSEKEKMYNLKVDECLKKINSGDRTGLYDLGEFLSDETEFTRVRGDGSSIVGTLRNFALTILYHNCYFKGLPFDEKITRETYDNYIEENGPQIFFYTQFDRFSDLDVHNVNFPHRIRKTIPAPAKSLDQLIEKIKEEKNDGHFTDMIEVFWEIGALQTREAEDFLLACAEGKHWGMEDCETKEKVLSGIAFSLGNFRTERSLEMLLKLASDYELYAMEDWAKAMAKITNRELIIENGSYEGIINHYENLLKEYNNIEAIRESGYDLIFQQYQLLKKSPLNIVEAIDYEWWVFDNQQKDLIEQKDPLVLHLVASRLLNDLFVYNDRSKQTRFNLFEEYEWASIEFNITKMLKELTGVVVELNYNGTWRSESDDFEFNVALMNYWKTHYNDYKFKNKTNLFTNTKEVPIEPDLIKVYFENMHTDNNELAMNAYLKLIEEDPDQVIHTMKTYNMDYIMGSLNNSLPMFTRKFLVQQCLLVNYCKQNNIPYKASGDLLELLEMIRTQNLNFKTQIKIEDDLYNMINLDNLIAIESYTITYGSRNARLTELVGHVLDQWYSDHIDLILNDSFQLKTYLYKAALYDRLGIIGIVNNFLRKLYGIHPDKLGTFEAIAKNDSNEDIRKNALSVVNNNLHTNKDSGHAGNMMTFSRFLKLKADIDNASLEKIHLDTSNLDSINYFFDEFVKENDSDILFKYIILMDRHLQVDMIPNLVENFGRDEEIQSGYWGGTDVNGKRHHVDFTAYTNDYMVHFTEKIFDYYNENPLPDIFNNDFISSSSSGPVFLWNKHKTQEFWLEKWASNPDNYKNWGNGFFISRLEKLNNRDTISYKDLEEVVESRFWDRKTHMPFISNVLNKLSCEDLVDIKQDWNLPGYSFSKLIKKCDIPSGDIEKVAKKFYSDNLPEVLSWLEQKIAKSDEKLWAGSQLNSICWVTGFRDSLKLDQYSHHRKWIAKALKTYADSTNSEFDSKYADAFHINLTLSPLSFKDQLTKISEIKSIGVENAQEKLINEATFEEIQSNWEQVFALVKSNSDVKRKVKNKFGLFITEEDLSDPVFLDKVIRSGDNLSASYHLFARYLEIKNSDGSLNYEAIFNIVKYGNAEGFVSSGAKRWAELYKCIVFYVSKSWEEELKDFTKTEYPNSEVDRKSVILNYMVSKGYIPTQKYVPLSFANDSDVIIR
ncbi:MAG: hypothetical protein AAF502_18975 [Bacteroidota bacterium]